MSRILFICTANICRSPMAHMMFNALAHDVHLPYQAESAGVAALTGRDMAEHAGEVLEEAGIRAEPHRARQVNSDMLSRADLVLAMSPTHVVELNRLFESSLLSKVHTLPHYLGGTPDEEIADPYGYPVTAYRTCLRHLYKHIDGMIKDLEDTRYE